MNIERVVKNEIFPSNRAANSNVWSYKDGNPTLTYIVSGVSDQYLLAKTLKLNFNFRLSQEVGGLEVFPNNDDQTGAGALDIRTNEMVGCPIAIQHIRITNAQNQTIEYVRDYPKLLASLIPARANFGDYATSLQQQFGATSNIRAQGMMNNNWQEVSMPLLTGLLGQGGMIPMGLRGTGGLVITIQMMPSIQGLYGAQGAGSWYSIVNPSLTFSMGVPIGGQLPPIKAYPYLSYSGFYNVLNNSDETHNINCNLSSVLNIFSTFVPTNWIANNTIDGIQTTNLINNPVGLPGGGVQTAAIVRNFSVMRGGLLYPYQFPIRNDRLISIVGGVEVSTTQAQLLRNYLSAVSAPLSELDSTLTGNLSEATQAAPNLGAAANPNFDATQYNTLGENVSGIGARMDQLANGDGANYRNRSYSHRIRSSLNGVSPNSVYTHMLHKNVLTFNDVGGIAITN